MAVNIVDSEADAIVPAGLTITAVVGPLTVTANNDTGNSANPVYGDTATASGAAVGTSSAGVGAAVALNLVNASAEAEIQTSSTQPTTIINTDGVAVTAGMLGASPMNAFGASATSGAGANDIGVAGAVAINIVNDTSQALIETGASVAAHGGNVSLTSLNNSTDTTSAVPVPGSVATGGTAGIGASLALNIISDTTQSEVQPNADLTGAASLTVTASSSHTIMTTATNGASGMVGIGAGIAIVIASDQTTASVGSDSATPLVLTGGLTIGASGSFSVVSVADATAATSGGIGIGASVVVNVAQDSFLADLDRGVTAAGAISVTANPVTSPVRPPPSPAKAAHPPPPPLPAKAPAPAAAGPRTRRRRTSLPSPTTREARIHPMSRRPRHRTAS